MGNSIVIKGAREHNLKNCTVQIQDNTLFAVMGSIRWARFIPGCLGKMGDPKSGSYGRNAR
ncbi:MAG: hypothetical protein ACXW39_06325 [Nitrospira sp.]